MSYPSHFSSANNTFSTFSENSNLRNVNVPQSISNTSEESIHNYNQKSHYIHTPNSNAYSLPTSVFPGTATAMTINRASQFCNDASSPRSLNNASFPRPLNAPFPGPLHNASFPRTLNNAPYPGPLNKASPLSQSGFTNTPPHVSGCFPSQPFNPNHDQTINRNVIPSNVSNPNDAKFNFDHRNISLQCPPPPPVSNMTCNNLPPNFNYPRFQSNVQFNYSGNVPISSPPFPGSVNLNKINNFNSHINYSAGNVNNSAPQAVYTSPLTVRPQDSLHNPSIVQLPLQMLQNDSISGSKNSNSHLNPLLHDMEVKIDEYISMFSIAKKEKKQEITIPEFRYVVKAALRMINLLNERKNKLSKLLDASEIEWELEVENSLKEKEELSALCSFVSDSDYVSNIAEKLKLIKRKRERKKKTKENKLSEKMRAEQKRKERDQEIDKWLDSIKEKNEKTKREAELKQEADFILLEVRRKIYEAKKTIEKIKVFEKLRNARQANASQKGLHVLSMHNAKFEKKMSMLKETMFKQLADYEAEEKALKVMLETEQEGQLEEKVQWKINKMKSLQQNKQNHIMESLFGIPDDPLPTDPLYLFHKYHTSATSSIENLVQIRQQWDIHIAGDGESIPQQWIVPVAPSNSSWEQCLVTSKS